MRGSTSCCRVWQPDLQRSSPAKEDHEEAEAHKYHDLDVYKPHVKLQNLPLQVVVKACVPDARGQVVIRHSRGQAP
jgi:hypothetical protein